MAADDPAALPARPVAGNLRANNAAAAFAPPTPSLASLFAYGGFGMPLAFAALPIYVVLPDWYAQRFGMPLALIGLLLLGARLADALADPLLGMWVDRLRQAGGYRPALLLAVPLLGAGFAALFHPPAALGMGMLALWMMTALLVTYGGFSLASIAYQAWGAGLSDSPAGHARVTAAREGCGLVGVVLAAVLPQWIGMTVVTVLLIGILVLTTFLLLRHAPRVEALPLAPPAGLAAMYAPLSRPAFRRLLAVFIVSGIASAVPATLVLFFVRDALGLAPWSGLFLALYFIAGAAALPLWVRLVGRIGLVRAWLAGMALTVLVFVWVLWLPAAEASLRLPGFALLSALSGVALGADLALPAALLAGVIRRAGDQGRNEGAYFGLWNLATKLNLALAAGVALPLLGVFGYQPGTGNAHGVQALTLAYCLLPCLLKICSATLLWRGRHQLEGD
ncbi:MAG: MFS transporter [Lacisediminimonas sp.]|nr:MFS transporter [Lacisediminimonas sp.]